LCNYSLGFPDDDHLMAETSYSLNELKKERKKEIKKERKKERKKEPRYSNLSVQ
jgi:hypothetical protein